MARTAIVWGEDAAPGNPRTDPPRHAEAVALAFYHRVASVGSRRQRRFAFRPMLLGLGLVAVGAAVFPFDLPLLHLGSLGLAGIGLVFVLKGLMGYGR